MAGINLSQSTGEQRIIKQRANLDKSFVFIILLTLFVAVAWGGIRWFLYSTEKEIQQLQAEIEAAKPRLEGESVNRVVDFQTRLEDMSAQAGKRLDTNQRFTALERVTLLPIVLTEYGYDADNGVVTITGLSNDYRTLAQQLISFKSEEELSDLHVEEIVTTEEGQISFTVKAETLSLDLTKN